MNGYNENPMAHQFISAYRKLLHQSDILISNYSNVASQCSSNVLTVSSTTKQTLNTNGVVEDDWNEILDLESLENANYLTDMHDSGIAYVAKVLEDRLITSNVHCNLCRKVLSENKKVNDNICVSLQYGKPCKSTYQLCKLTDTALKVLINTGANFKQKVYLSVMNNMDFENIFPVFYESVHDIDHKHYLIKFIIDEYINKKCAYVAKQHTIALHRRFVRNRLRKLAHFMHQ